MSEKIKNERAEIDRSTAVAEMAFEIMEKAFRQAVRSNPRLASYSFYTLAGKTVKVHIVGKNLAQKINLPFSHLATENTASISPSLTIELWDGRETGIPCHISSRRRGLDLNPISFKSNDGRLIIHQLQQSIICFDQEAGRIIGCAMDAEQLSLYERGRPLHMPLSVWHDEQDIPIIHAGLVSTNGRGVIFAGKAGSGKSTSALLCGLYGLNYLSDDLIGLEMLKDGSFAGHSIYNSTFLETDHLERFPLLKPHAIEGKYAFEEKLLILLSKIPGLRFERSCRINAIVLPSVGHGTTTRISPTSKIQALLALMPTFQVGHFRSKARGFEKLSQLVERLPCYRMELGSDMREIPHRVEDILAEIKQN